jgi:hypothetical protein
MTAVYELVTEDVQIIGGSGSPADGLSGGIFDGRGRQTMANLGGYGVCNECFALVWIHGSCTKCPCGGTIRTEEKA